MPRRGRPRKNRFLYLVKDLVEFSSDRESDTHNVQNNHMYQVSVRDRSPIKNTKIEAQDVRRRQQSQRVEEEHEQQQEEEEEHDQQQQQQEQEKEEEEEEEEQVRRPQQQQQDLEQLRPTPHQQHGAELLLRQSNDDQEQLHRPPQQTNEDEQEHQDEEMHQEDDEAHRVHEHLLQEEGHEEDLTEDDEMDEEEDYDTILEKLKSKWLLTEASHSVSKSASEAFWKVSLDLLPKLNQGVGRKKKIAQFKTIRKKMYEDLLPEIELEIGYKQKSTGDVIVVKDTITPLKQFSTSKYEKLYEIGTVKVKNARPNI